MDNKCAPGKKYSEGSCFTLDDLKEIATQYNNSHSDTIDIALHNTKKELLKQLIDRFKKNFDCEEQLCWLSTSVLKGIKNTSIINGTFRPKGPSGKYDWLSTKHIEDVMKQYEQIYPDFYFLGAVPSDFDEHPVYETTDLVFKKLEATTPKLGLVINLDTHNQSGSHWVGLFINLQKNTIYYFDSFRKQPQNRVRSFITRVLSYMETKEEGKKIDVGKFMKRFKKSDKYDVRYNKVQHQYKDSECGVYSMHFLIKLLEGKTFDEIVNNVIDDDTMNEYRAKIFRNV